MAEDDPYIAAFNEKFRGEFVKCINVDDFIVALGTLTRSDEENIRARHEKDGNTLAATRLCERLCRRPNWKESILKALRSENIRQGDLAKRMEEEFRAIETKSANSSHGSVSNSNVNQSMQLLQTPQQGTQPATFNFNLSFYQGATPKENQQLVIGYTSPTSADSAVCGSSRLATNFSNAPPTFPEKDKNIIPLNKYEEQLVADAVDGKNVLIIVPNGDDESRSRIPAHICTTHLQNSQRGNGVKKRKAVCLTSPKRLDWLSNFGKYLPTFGVYTILDDQKNITAESVEKNEVILTTAEIFERALTSEVLTFNDITLLILDECHFSRQAEHTYHSIMISYITENLTDSALTQVVGLLTSSNIQDQEDMKGTEDNLSDLMYTLDAMFISTIEEEQIYPGKVAHSSVVARRQDDPFHSLISKIMLEIEEKLDVDIKSLERHSEDYGCHIEEKEKKDGRSVLLKHLAVYNKALQMNEIMRTKDAFALLKKFYREHDEHDDDDEWLGDLYLEHSSELYKLSKGESKYENPRLAHLKRDILKKSEKGDFKAIIVSEHRQVREALHEWLSSDFKNLTTKSLNITDKSSVVEDFNADRRIILISTELKDAKLVGVKMAVIFSSIMDGIRIFQSDDDVTQELLGLVAELQFNKVVKRLQDLPESVKRKNLQKKKLQLLRGSGEMKEQNISKLNLSENIKVDDLGVVKDVSDKSYSCDTNVRGQTSEREHVDVSESVKSPTASSLNIKSEVFTEREECASVNASGKAIESTKHIPSKSLKIDINASSEGKKIENQSRLSEFELFCRGGTADGKCNVFVCSLSEVRLMSQTNHVYNKCYWNWSKIDVREHHDETKKKFKTKKIYCKVCGADWGNTFKRYPCLKLKNFLVRLPNGKWRSFSQWKLLDVSIPPMEDQ